MNTQKLFKNFSVGSNSKKKIKELKICWVDNLNIFSFLKLIWINRKYSFNETRYMKISLFAKIIIKKFYMPNLKIKSIFNSDRIISAEEEKRIEIKANNDVIFIIYKLIKPSLLNSWMIFFKTINPRYDKEKIIFFFEQEIGRDIETSTKLFNYVNLFCYQNNNDLSSKYFILIANNFWLPFLKMNYEKEDLKIASYINLKEIIHIFYIPFKIFTEIFINTLLIFINKFKFKTDNLNTNPNIGVLYVQGANLEKRSDYFWFPNSGINPKRVLLYFKYSVRPPTTEVLEYVKNYNISWFNLLPIKIGSKRFFSGTMELNRFPSPSYLKKLIKTFCACFLSFIYCLYKTEAKILWSWKTSFDLLNTVDLFESFFLSHNIKVHFSQYEAGKDMSAANIALDLTGGIDVTTHWSNFDFFSLDMGKAHDIYFSWGPFFKENFFNYEFFQVKNIIYSGYLYDYFFNSCREKSKQYRDVLLKNGAEFIVSFFDQSRPLLKPAWSKEVENIYRFLFEEVINNKEFGIIIKPKKTLNLWNSPFMSEVFNMAISTNRCLILNGNVLPCEAAFASDLAIGMGVSSTPITETMLSGIPSIAFDPSYNVNHPLNIDGWKDFVFKDLNDLKKVIEEFRNKKEMRMKTEYHTLSLLNDIDCFRDGKASERIGKFINWLLDSFDKGLTKQDAIELSLERYRQQWGSDKVVCLKKDKNFSSDTQILKEMGCLK